MQFNAAGQHITASMGVNRYSDGWKERCGSHFKEPNTIWMGLGTISCMQSAQP